MTDTLLTTSEVSKRLGHASTAATRSWLRRHRAQVPSRGRHAITGAMLYSATDVEKAIRDMPQGPRNA